MAIATAIIFDLRNQRSFPRAATRSLNGSSLSESRSLPLGKQPCWYPIVFLLTSIAGIIEFKLLKGSGTLGELAIPTGPGSVHGRGPRAPVYSGTGRLGRSPTPARPHRDRTAITDVWTTR